MKNEDRFKNEMKHITLPKNLHDYSIAGVNMAIKEKNKKRMKGIYLVVAAILLSGGGYSMKHWLDTPLQSTISDQKVNEDKDTVSQNSMYSRSEKYIVYENRNYLKASATIPQKYITTLRGRKIGETVVINEKENVTNNHQEEPLISSQAEVSVYTIKGYSDQYRLLALNPKESLASAEIYEVQSESLMKNGEEFIIKYGLDKNIDAAKYQKTVEETSQLAAYKSIKPGVAQDLLEALKKSNFDELKKIDEKKELGILKITQNHITYELTIFESGFVVYDHYPYALKINSNDFEAILSQLQK